MNEPVPSTLTLPLPRLPSLLQATRLSHAMNPLESLYRVRTREPGALSHVYSVRLLVYTL